MSKGPKKAKQLSVKQLKAREALIAGKSKRQAVMEAGYSRNAANSGGKTAAILGPVLATLQEAIAANPRLTPKIRSEKLADLMDAKEPKWNPKRGRFELFEAGDLQLRAVQEVNRGSDSYPAPKEPVQDSRPITIVFGKSLSSMMPPQKQQGA